MLQLISFAVSAIVLLAGHFALWHVLSLFFSFNPTARLSAGIVIAFLFVSTIIASYLIHRRDNPFFRCYYIFAGIWIGLLLNFGIMTVVVLTVSLVSSSFGFSLSPVYLQIIFISGTLFISGFGLYRAWRPAITYYEVAIKDLPSSWEGKNIIHISDVHLGPVYRGHFLSRLVEQINSLQPEAVFITGDFFDGMEADFSWLANPLSRLNPPQGVYYSFGNHDLYLGFNNSVRLLSGSGINIMSNKMTVVSGLQIIGINYSFNTDFNLETAILEQVGYSALKPSILLFHVPKNVELAKAAGIDLQLSGHTHDGQLFPFNLVARWMHGGHGYGLFKEGDFSLIVTSGVGTWGPPMRTSARSEIVVIKLKKKN